MFVIPVLNVDGFELIGDEFDHTKQLMMVRKNRHVYNSQVHNCPLESYGVDLNRNYWFEFGFDDTGSTGD